MIQVEKQLERLYTGRCTIMEYVVEADPKTHITGHPKEQVVYENIPCRLSRKSFPAAVQGDGNGITEQIKLFLSPEIEVKAGSKITVTQNGMTRDYKNSGVSAVYSSHQEVELELFRGWA